MKVEMDQVNVRLFGWQKKSLVDFANDKGITVAELSRYGLAATFKLLEDKTPEQCRAIVDRQSMDDIIKNAEVIKLGIIDVETMIEVQNINNAMERFQEKERDK